MDDLERDLATQLRRRSEEVTPGEDLPARIRAQVGRHQRRRRLMQTAVPTLGVLIGAVTLVAVVGHGGGTRSSSSAAPSAAPSAGPSHRQAPSTTRLSPAPSNGSSKGAPSAGPSVNTQAPASGFRSTTATWVPINFGDVQVSVPSGAVIGSSGCPDPTATVTIHLGRQPAGVFGCPFEPVGVTTLTLESLPTGRSTSGLAAHTVNGVKVFSNFGSPAAAQELVPSLGVEVQASGPLASRVLGTLTRSPRAVALAGGGTPRAPRSWRRVTFGGLSAAVPSNWTVEHVTDEDASCEPQPPGEPGGVMGDESRPTVILDTGQGPLPPCPAILAEPDQPVEQASDGLVIDPGPIGPLSGVTSYSRCISVDRLRICPTNDAGQYGELVLGVHTRSGKKVAVVIGDGMSGETARTILYSLRPA
jgi:hypothetical protein